MHLLPILSVVGTLLLVLGGMQLIPMAASLAFGEADWPAFLISGAGGMALGGAFLVSSRGAREITERDGFTVVTLGWISAAISGAAPYLISGTPGSITDALFESLSGFTTTGASVLTEYGALSHGFLLWRSMTQWFGGMGIIVMAVVILPALGVGGMQLYKREVPGPYSEKLTPRLRDTARALWSVYALLTILCTAAYFVAGMTPFEAVNHALTTISTAGFSTRGDSIAGFSSAAIEWTAIAFMLVSGMNFALHFRLLARPRHRAAHLHDAEWVWFVGISAAMAVLISAYLFFTRGYALPAAATKGTFQVISILTTTGYSSDDYMRWGAFPQLVLMLLMIVGGCAGSTSGGAKLVRIILLFKFIGLEMLRLLHPKVVVHARLGHLRVPPEILGKVLSFIFLYLTTVAAIAVLISLAGHPFLTSLGAAVSAVGNIGPGLGDVGPAGNYAGLSNFAKWVFMAGMLLGRLELMTVLVLFLPQAWRR
ncbi:MAG: TrkH family potassium uptake protein [SAR324 cluster bacterium]|nr:TrkH family potassium uptake protein [SAR324 cluster bacterium]